MKPIAKLLAALHAAALTLSGAAAANAQPHPQGEQQKGAEPLGLIAVSQSLAYRLPRPDSGLLAEAFESLVEYEIRVAQTDLSDSGPADLSGFEGDLDQSEPAPQAAESFGGPY